MSSTPLAEPTPLRRLLSRPALVSGLAVSLAVALAWAWLFANAGMDEMWAEPAMAGMSTGPGPLSSRYLLSAFAMWALMMVAMMLPSAAPMILLHARIDRGSEAQRSRDSLLFVLCYLVVWSAFSLLAALAQAGLVATGFLSSRLAASSHVMSAALLFAAAGWQLTTAKTACLDQCRSPLHFVMRYWKPGAAGAVRLGLRHGLYCLGCCWSLMLLLFVGGVMNLAWIAALATVVFVEKLAPPEWRVDRWLAAVLAGGGAYLLVN